MPWTWDSPSPAESMEHMDDKILQKINESYVQSLMKMMSSKVLKELRAENETIQQHLGALTSDVHLLASQLASRKEDKSWHHEAKLEALREELHLGAAREKELVAELGQLKRLVEGRHEDLLAHHRHLDKDLRTALRELRSDASEVQRDSLNSLQDVRSSLRDLRSDLEEQREALKSLQETDFLKQLGDARQALADLQEERQWHEDAMKQLRDSHQDQQMRRQADSADLDQRVEGFRQMLESTLPNDELEKRHQVLTQHMEQLMAQLEKNRRKDKEELKEKFDQLQQHSEGRMEECLDRARLLDQDILDKLNPELLNIKACKEACPAPEDPEKRVRLFSEHWSRVSSKTISNPQRVEVVRLPGSHGCGNISRPLPVFPAGLLQMRELLPKLFSGHCDMGEVQDWAHKTNFILIDLSIGQALLVGTGVELVTPDSSLGSFKDDGSNEAAPALQGSDYLLQAQRLSRWLRKLPNTHRGWIVVADEALSLWQQRFVRSGRRYPLLSPACISRVTAHGGHKFRVTPGTKWCGDAGWSHVDFFPVLRSGTNIPAEKRVPICISFNKVGYYYRFENSVRGCMGKHRPTGTHWTHAHTIYTSRDATGQAYCVGMKEDREHTRWTMQKGDICSSDGFKHSFGFRAMRNDYTSPLAPCCILVALQSELGSKETPLQRFAAGKECESSSEWRVVYKLVLWSKPIGAEHHRMCLAAGSSEKVAEDGSAARDPHEVFRVFYDSACEKKSLVTFEGERKFYWTISTENLFLPETATGVHLCLCHVVLSKLASPQESVKKKDMPFYTWVESKCPRGAKKELCFNTLEPSDVLNAVHLVDEIV
ncbi:unnamed protein product [Durusdinium trenchii]|uniref:Uncharacterized protein n=1 Tax=Durusdinium trenchii TaxID=1381693 RepID=A0ABP0JFH6_9DINO